MTMVELMVAVGILVVVVAGVMETFVVNNRAYTVVDDTTSAQQNLRAISYLIERDLRATGFMVPEGVVTCGIDRTNAPDTLYVTDTEPIDPTNQAQANLGVRVTGYTGAMGVGLPLVAAALGGLNLDGTPFYDNSGDGNPDSDFACNSPVANCGGVGGAVILYDADNPARGTACGQINAIGGNVVRVEFETSIGGGIGDYMIVPAVRYAIDPDPVTGIPTLMRNQIALATDVEDFQVAWFLDLNGDGDEDANEYRGSAASAIDYASAGVDHGQLREVRFNLVVRSRNPDPTYSEGFCQTTENRGVAAAADGFRRRVTTSIVRPRNIGFRGAQPGGV
jgi:type II secretory pathway pseudopilin PulG